MKIYLKELNVNENIVNKIKENIEEIIVEKDVKLIDILLKKYENGFENETQVFINRELIEVENYDIELKDNDLITINNLPQDPVSFLIMLTINIVISLLMSYLFKPKKTNDVAAVSIYSTKNNQISAKLGSPFPIQYGNIRQYPILIAKDYSFYSGNDEYQVLHTTLGVGEYTINNVYMNETNITELEGNNVDYFKLGVGSKDLITKMKTNFNTISSDFMAYVVQEAAEVASVALDEGATIGYNTINESDTQISKVLINFNFNNGIYSQSDEGDLISSNVNIKCTLLEIDDSDNETGYQKVSYLNITKSTRTAVRESLIISVKNGRYKIKLERLDTGFDSKTSKNCVVENVYGFDTNNDTSKINSVSTVTFLVKVSSSISTSSSFSINVDCTRNDVGTTLRDCIKDIWMNENYGMNEDISFLDIRSQLDEEISLYLDAQEIAFDQIHSLLKSFGYKFYPYLTKFVIKKEASQLYNKYQFNSKNSTKITFTYNLSEDTSTEKGVKVSYLKSGSSELTEYYFPADKNSYDETLLMGVNDEITAKKMASFIYDKQKKITKTAQVETSLNGLIPEIDDRVGIAVEYIDDNFSCFVKDIDTDNQIITLDQNYQLNAGVYYVQLIDIDNTVYPYLTVNITEDTFTNELNYEDTTSFSIINNQNLIAIVGDLVEVVESFIITDIESIEFNEDISKASTVTLNLQKYVGEIYQNIEY